jgi:hypothetical protein
VTQNPAHLLIYPSGQIPAKIATVCFGDVLIFGYKLGGAHDATIDGLLHAAAFG